MAEFTIDTSSLTGDKTAIGVVPTSVEVGGVTYNLTKDTKGYFYYSRFGAKHYVYDIYGAEITTSSDAVARVIGEANGYIGAPYVWGGNTGDGIDCSGLVKAAYAAVGVELPRTSQAMYSQGPGTRVSLSNLQPGDLLFFGTSTSAITHVAIYIGNGQMIESAPSHGGVDIVDVDYQPNLIAAKRISGAADGDFGDSPEVGQYSYAPATAVQDFTSVYENIDDIFQYYLGRDATSAEKEQAKKWSSDHVLRYIKTLPEWVGSPGYDRLRAAVQARWSDIVGGTAPADFIAEAIAGDWTDEQIDEKIRAHKDYKTGREYETNRLSFIDAWESKIGFDLTDAAKTTLDTALANGWTMTMWEDWIEQQPEYETGVEQQGKKAAVLNQLDGLWGRGAVDAKLASDPEYVKNTVWKELGTDASPEAIERWARKQPEWMSGPEASASRVALDDYYRTIMRTAPTAEDLDQWVRDGLTTDQLLLRLRETDEYKATYAAKMPWQSEQEFIYERDAFNAIGRWYFQNDDFQYSDSQLAYFFEHGIDADEMAERYRWTEEAASQLLNTKGTWAYALEAMGITLTEDMAYTIASGAEGSGDLLALITQGKNRRAFDEAFHTYTGRWPGAGDYAYLESNFAGPSEYAARMAAKEQAAEQFPNINEMFQRVYGYEADLAKVQNWLLGGEGGGAYGALIQAAEELDRYTLTWREYARTDPTPQQYAEWAGFAGPSELQKLLNARELVAQNGREIMDVYNSYWVAMGALPITEEDIFTLEGQYQGWGAIDARLQMAAEHRERQQQARRQALSGYTAQAYTVATQFGGPQTPFLTRPQG